MDARLHRYKYSDWAGSIDDIKSTSGYTFWLGFGIFSWASRKQESVAKSSVEAKYVAAIRARSQAIWLKRILEDMGECQQGSTTILYDNKQMITIMENHVFHSRTKHISIKYYFLREAVGNKKLILSIAGLKKN